MDFIKYLFWNEEQIRLRSGYRILLGVILALVFGFIFVTLTGLRTTNSTDAPLWHIIYKGTVRLITTFLAIWIIGRFLDKRKFADFGFHFNKAWWIDFTFGAVLGIVSMSAIFIFEYYVGWIKITDTFYVAQEGQSFFAPLLVFLFLFICVSLNEELTSRGFMLTNIAEGLTFKKSGPKVGIILALVISSGIFGLFHAGNPNATIIAVLNIVFAGVLLGTAFVLTGRLAIPIGLHITWNFFQGTIFGFPVSGNNFASTASVFAIEQGGPDFWTGGAFGPEAGMLGLLAMIIGILLILAWTKFREGKVKLFTALAMPPRVCEESLEVRSEK